MSLSRTSRVISLSRTLSSSIRRIPVAPPSASAIFSQRARYLFYTTSATTTTLTLLPRRVLAEYSTLTSPASAASLPDITLYQYEVCPFCNKVRAYLDYHKIPYRVVEVDPLRKTELKHLPDDYRKVPIAIVNGDQVNGSSDVIAHVETLVKGSESAVSQKETDLLKWLDDRLIHLIAPNIYRTWSESLQTFDYIAENSKFSAWQRTSIKYSGATAMYFVGRKLKKKYDIENEREEIHAAIAEWTDVLENTGTNFQGGDKPGVVDLSVYGVLKAIETFDTFKELIERNPQLEMWYAKMKNEVGQPAVTGRQ